MKKIVLAIMILSGFSFGGTKVQLTVPNFMCSTKNPSLFTYLITLTLATADIKDAKAMSKQIKLVISEVDKRSKGDCMFINPNAKINAKILKKQKSSVNNTVYEYLKIKILNVGKKDFSSKNLHMWTVSLPSAPTYKEVN